MTDNFTSPWGSFSYPESGGMKFNYIDSVITTWTTYDPNATACLFSLWYYLDSSAQPWTLALNESVAANGTKEFPLDIASEPCLGQWNINYTAADGTLHKYLSPLFDINHDSTQPSAVVWNRQALSPNSPPPTSQASGGTAASPTSKSSVASSTSYPPSTSNVSPTSLLPSPTPSALPSAKGSSLSGGAVAGIVVATVVGIVLGGLLFALLWMRRRKKRVEPQVLLPPPGLPPRLDDPRPLHEVDGHSRPENELSGGRDQWELPTNKH